MSVNVGQLDYISTLDNSDFKAKTLEDLQLIRLRLELEGDTAGIEKHDAAVKATLANQTALQKEMVTVLEDAIGKTNEFTAAVQKPVSKTVFSDSAVEAAAYNNEITGVIDKNVLLNEQVTEQTALMARLDIELKNGLITQEFYNQALGIQVAQIEKVTAATIEEKGVLDELELTLERLKASQSGATASQLPIINKQIQETEQNIKQFANVGKVGFDDFGNKITQTAAKTGVFEKAIGRVTNISNIGARVVTQLSRQIIGLGVGLLSFAIGSKAIEFIINFISNLDIFTGRLDVAKQALAAFNEIQAKTAETASQQIAPLRQLYDTTQDVTLSLKERTKAAEQLRDLYPAEFQNATDLSIINGKLKVSYDDLTDSIIASARAAAEQSLIAEQEAKIIGAELQQQKIRNANANEIRDAKKDGTIVASGEAAESVVAGQGDISVADQIKASNDRAKQALKDQQDIINTANGVVKVVESVIKSTTKSSQSLADANKLLGDNLQNFDALINGSTDKVQFENIQKALQVKLNALAPNDAQVADIKKRLQQVDDILKEYQVKATKTAKTDPSIAAGKTLLAEQTSALQKIQALKDKYASSNKTQNEKEQDDLKATFALQINNITALNKKHDDFVAKYGSARAGAVGLQRIDVSTISDNQTNALNALRQTQANQTENEFIEQDIEKKKALYADYEAYKLKVGATTANAEYADLIQSGKNFETYLDNILSAIDKSDTSAPILERLEKTKKAISENSEVQKNAFKQLLIDTETYEEKRQSIIDVSEDAISKLNKAGFNERAAQVKQNAEDELTTLDEANFKKLQLYKDTFDGITNLSKKQTAENLNELKEQLKIQGLEGNLTSEAYDTLYKKITDAQKALTDNNGRTLQEVGSALSSLGNDLKGVNETLGSIVSTAAGALSALGKVFELKKQIGTDTDDDVKLGHQIELYATAASAVVGIINDITSAAAQRKEAESAYYNSIIASQNQYNLSLIDQIRLQEQLNGSVFFKDYKADILDASKALAAANTAFEKSLADLQGGQAKNGTRNAVNVTSTLGAAASGAVAGAVIGGVPGAIIGGAVGLISGLFGSKKAVDTFAPLLVQYPDLITKAKDGTDQFSEALAKNLIQNNLVSDSTKVLLQNTIDLYDERQASIDQIKSDISDLAGSLGDDLRTSLVTAFEDGTDAAKAFGDSVSKIIENIVSQFLFNDIFGAQLKKLQDNLTASFGITGDQNAVDDLTGFFKDTSPLVAQYEAALAAAKAAAAGQGLNIFQPTNGSGSTNSLTGGIQASLTEDTASIIGGALKGIQLSLYDMNLILKGQSLSYGQMLSIAQNTLNTAILIEINTRRTADTADLMLGELKDINGNTKSTADIDLRAAGFYHF